MRFTHGCDAARHLLQCTMEPYFTVKWRQMRWPGLAGRKGDNNVGRNPQLPPRLEALQREPEGALPARRPRIGRYRHYAVGHSAHRMGKRRSRKLKKNARFGGLFSFGSRSHLLLLSLKGPVRLPLSSLHVRSAATA